MDGAGAPRVRRETHAPADAPFGPAALAAALEPAFAEVAGDAATCISLDLQFGAPPAPGTALQVEAWVERATRTLVFAAATVRGDDDALAGAGSAVFRRA